MEPTEHTTSFHTMQNIETINTTNVLLSPTDQDYNVRSYDFVEKNDSMTNYEKPHYASNDNILDNHFMENHPIPSELTNTGTNHETVHESITYASENSWAENTATTFSDITAKIGVSKETSVTHTFPPFECGICGKAYKRKTEFLKHSSEKHDIHNCNYVENSVDCYACSKCDEIVRGDDIHPHVIEDRQQAGQNGQHKHPCSVCSRVFASKDSWLAHLQSGIHDKLAYKCIICSSSFTSPNQLVEHVSSHQPERRYSCSECSKSFIYPISLQKHLTCHNQNASSTKQSAEAVDVSANDSDGGDDVTIKCNKSDKSKRFNCDVCGLKYAYRQGLRKHQRKVHGSKQSYSVPRSCSKCTRTFVKAWYLNEHEKYCSGSVPKVKPADDSSAAEIDKKCPVCNQIFSNRRRMLAHKRDSHRPRLVCDICGHSFTRSTSLRKHIKHSHEGKRDFICDSCGKQFTAASSLKRHERLHVEARPFKCKVCDRAYSTNYLLLVHSELHIEEKEKNFQCEKCAHRFSRLLTLKHHSKRTCERRIAGSVSEVNQSGRGVDKRNDDGRRSGKGLPATKPAIPCSMCKRRFRTETVLARHVRFMHNDDSSLTCQVCGLIFRTVPCFRKHQALHNGILHRCRYCQKTFMSKNTMFIHERRQHTGETPYACTMCGEAFVTERRLTAHQLVHVGKEIKCDYCHAIFASNHERDKHVRRHTGEKPHICCICARGFSTKRLMESHIRTHTGERPFSCNICSARYAEARGLKNHLLASHPDRRPQVQVDAGTEQPMMHTHHTAEQLDPQAHHLIQAEVNMPRMDYDRQISLVPSSQSEHVIFFQKL